MALFRFAFLAVLLCASHISAEERFLQGLLSPLNLGGATTDTGANTGLGLLQPAAVGLGGPAVSTNTGANSGISALRPTAAAVGGAAAATNTGSNSNTYYPLIIVSNYLHRRTHRCQPTRSWRPRRWQRSQHRQYRQRNHRCQPCRSWRPRRRQRSQHR